MLACDAKHRRVLISSDSKCLRFGLSLRFGLRCEHPRCQIASDVGRAMRTSKLDTVYSSRIEWFKFEKSRGNKRTVSSKRVVLANVQKQETQRKRKKHFKTVSENGAFSETVCGNFMRFTVFGRIVLENGSAPFLSSSFLSLRFGLPKCALVVLVFDAGEHRMYPRPGFWYRGTSECSHVPAFGTGEHRALTTLLETTLFLRISEKEPDTSKCLGHVMRAILSARPKCSHSCDSLNQRFRKGVGGRGLAANKAPKKSPKTTPEMCPPFS